MSGEFRTGWKNEKKEKTKGGNMFIGSLQCKYALSGFSKNNGLSYLLNCVMFNVRLACYTN